MMGRYGHAEHRPNTLWFYKPGDGGLAERTHHRHFTEPGSDLWHQRLAFRDALWRDPDLRAEYAAPAAIAQYRVRLTALLAQLQAAAPDAESILTGAYDPNVGAFAFADPLFQALNDAEAAAGDTVRARFADPFPVFNPPGDVVAETIAIGTLTLVCSAGDGHPSDAGYRELGERVWEASGYDRLAA